jgi:uncharacterized SAM-binding protein YcdF (DUF218 family)
MSLLALVTYLFKKRKYFKTICYSGFILLLICSTSYIPKKLLVNLESKYPVLEPHSLDTSKQYYIHVLGAGYSLDYRLPALSKMETISLARLTEGIRIFQQLPGSILVTSGYSSLGLQSQASVAKQAAIELGVPESQIQMLETPSTTLEEVQAFKDKFGLNKAVIIATDARHMPRAIKTYRKAGFKPIAAPTYFRVKFGPNSYNGFTLPSVQSIQIMDQWIREKLSTLKLVFTDSKILE